eukprot:4643628-Ditylum_brightwellii.AAC.1
MLILPARGWLWVSSNMHKWAPDVPRTTWTGLSSAAKQKKVSSHRGEEIIHHVVQQDTNCPSPRVPTR